MLLGETEQHTLPETLQSLFHGAWCPELFEHTLESLAKQPVIVLALGYEDLNGHDSLRRDALFALLSNKTDLQGARRFRVPDEGKALAGKSRFR